MRTETVSPVSMRDVVERLSAVPGREDRLTHLEVLPARAAVEAAWPIVGARRRPGGVRGPRRAHPVAAPGRGRRGGARRPARGDGDRHRLGQVAGLPAADADRRSAPRRGPRGQRGAATLYLSPTKALAQDQLAGLEALGLDLRVATHDGDSPREQRDWTRDHAEYVLTNPDMLHRSLLPAHYRWAQFLGRCATSWSTSATTTAACSAPTWRRCCAGCGGCARRTAPTRRSCSPRPPSPSRRSHAHRLTGLDFAPGRRRRLAPRPGRRRALGAAVHLPHRRARRPGAPRRVVRDRRPAGRPGRRGRAHAGVHPVAARGRAGRADRGRAARRRRPGAGRPGGGLPRRLPARGAPRHRAGPALRRADGAGRDQRARARHRHQRARRRGDGGVPRHPRRHVAAGRPRRPWSRRRPRRAGRPRRPARHLPGHPPRVAVRQAGRGHRHRPGQRARARAAPVRRRPGAAADRGRPRRCSGRPRAACSTGSSRRAGCGAGRGAGSGPTGTGRPTSPTSARPAAARWPSSRPRPAGSSDTSTRRARTPPPTPAPSTCTGATPGWSSRSTSTTTSR